MSALVICLLTVATLLLRAVFVFLCVCGIFLIVSGRSRADLFGNVIQSEEDKALVNIWLMSCVANDFYFSVQEPTGIDFLINFAVCVFAVLISCLTCTCPLPSVFLSSSSQHMACSPCDRRMYFLVFYFLCVLTVMNVIIAVFLDFYNVEQDRHRALVQESLVPWRKFFNYKVNLRSTSFTQGLHLLFASCENLLTSCTCVLTCAVVYLFFNILASPDLGIESGQVDHSQGPAQLWTQHFQHNFRISIVRAPL